MDGAQGWMDDIKWITSGCQTTVLDLYVYVYVDKYRIHTTCFDMVVVMAVNNDNGKTKTNANELPCECSCELLSNTYLIVT